MKNSLFIYPYWELFHCRAARKFLGEKSIDIIDVKKVIIRLLYKDK